MRESQIEFLFGFQSEQTLALVVKLHTFRLLVGVLGFDGDLGFRFRIESRISRPRYSPDQHEL